MPTGCRVLCRLTAKRERHQLCWQLDSSAKSTFYPAERELCRYFSAKGAFYN